MLRQDSQVSRAQEIDAALRRIARGYRVLSDAEISEKGKQMSILDVPGARLYYETHGSGPLMIMIPGALATPTYSPR